jgi:3-isopropylmalate/(R)-2-methylmalate dehydratase small subunit
MQNRIVGKAFVLGDDIDTDQIIPAEYLVYNPSDPDERPYFGMYAMSGVPPHQSGLPEGHLPFVREGEFKSDYTVVVGGKNFGCGSSREHAPLAVAEAGVPLILAEYYARIFYRNSINGGYLLPGEVPERICQQVRSGDELEVDVEAGTIHNHTTGQDHKLNPLGEVKPIIEAGGVFEYARQSGMLSR